MYQKNDLFLHNPESSVILIEYNQVEHPNVSWHEGTIQEPGQNCQNFLQKCRFKGGGEGNKNVKGRRGYFKTQPHETD
jgi:hypothetical protein